MFNSYVSLPEGKCFYPKLSKGGWSKPINYNKDPEKLAILGHTGGFYQSHIGWTYIII